MSFLHTHSCECAKSEMDLFAIPPTQTTIESGHWLPFKNVSSLSDDGPLEFIINGRGDEFIDLSHTLLQVVVKVTKDDGGELTEADNVAPVNNLLHSMFSQVDVYLNEKLISPPNNTHGYKSYIETMLNYGHDAKSSHLTTALWYRDTHSKFNDLSDANQGFTKRKQFASGSKQIDLIGRLHGDIFNQEKFLLNGVDLRIKLVRSRDNFVLMSASAGKLKIVDATLLIRRVKINPTVLLSISKVLENTPAKYPITRTEIKVLTLPAGIQSKSLDNIFLGQQPKRIVVGFVTNKAFNGHYGSNPFNFEHFNMNFFALYADGVQIPSKPLQPDFAAGNPLFVNLYQTLFSGTGIHFSNEGSDIGREHYAGGYCLMAFDLTPDLSANCSTHWNLVKNGSLRVEVGFTRALTETINCIVYAEFDNVIEIDKNRNVIVDYGS
jgi:hypothetical protein